MNVSLTTRFFNIKRKKVRYILEGIYEIILRISKNAYIFTVLLANLRPWSDHEFYQKTMPGPLILRL